MTERHVRGTIEIRPQERQVLLNGSTVPLGGRAFDVLMVLVQRRGHLVTKNELLDAVWPGLAVEENNLAVHVSNLRKALGSLSIVTVPGRGYTFMSALENAQVPGSAAALQAVPATPPLALAPPPLVGRDDDLAAVGQLMAEQALVVLVGAGGIGKTRLAQQLFADRIASGEATSWVELAAVSGSGQVPLAIGQTLGWGAGAAPATLPALARALAKEQRIVVVDNAEHLVAEVAGVINTLLREAPGVRWLVTSQVPLGVAPETVVRLEPLDLPAADAGLVQAQATSSVRFFVQRAQAADRRFVLDQHNVADVVSICRRLDGMPLALEMAAARVPLLGLKGMAAVMADQLQGLRSQRSDLPERQRTLRATLEWSHGLLGEQEQAALRRLGVFAGGFSLEMALEVMGAPPDDAQRWHWLNCLDELVDRSLVAVNHEKEVRYRLLESTRAFALERLSAAAEDDLARRRHVRATIDQLVSLRTRIDHEHTAQDEGTKLLVLELENARAAHAWSIAHDPAIALELMPLYSAVTVEHDQRATKAAWEATIPLYDEALPAAVRAEWAVPFALNLWNCHDRLGARRWADVAAPLCEQLRADRLRFDLARLNLLRALYDGGDVDAAMANMVDLSRHATPRVRRQLPALLAHVERGRGRLEQALAWATRALEAVRGTGNELNYLARLNNLADIHALLGQYGRAAELLVECSALARSHGRKKMLCHATLNLCEVQIRTGQVEAATRTAAEGWPLADTFQETPFWLDILAFLAAYRDQPGLSAQLIGHAGALRESLGIAHDIGLQAVVKLAQQRNAAALPAEELVQERERGAALQPADLQDRVRILLSPASAAGMRLAGDPLASSA